MNFYPFSSPSLYPYLPSSQVPFHTPLSDSPQKKKNAGLPETSTKHEYQVTKRPGTYHHITIGQGNTRGGKRSHKWAKYSDIAPAVTVKSHKNTKLLSHNIYAEDLGHTPADSLISANSHETRSLGSVGPVLMLFLTPLVFLLLSLPPHYDSLSSA